MDREARFPSERCRIATQGGISWLPTDAIELRRKDLFKSIETIVNIGSANTISFRDVHDSLKGAFHDFQPTRPSCYEAMTASCRNHRFYAGGKQYRSRTGAQIGDNRIGSGDQACVGALEYEKPTSPERGGVFRSGQFWTLLGVLYLLVPPVPPETTGKGLISISEDRRCPRAHEQLTPHASARVGEHMCLAEWWC